MFCYIKFSFSFFFLIINGGAEENFYSMFKFLVMKRVESYSKMTKILSIEWYKVSLRKAS